MIYKIFFFNRCVQSYSVYLEIYLKHLPMLPFFPIVQHSDQRDHNDDRWQGREPLAGGRLAPALLPVQSCSRTQTQISRYLRCGGGAQHCRIREPGSESVARLTAQPRPAPRSLGGDTAGSTTPDTTLQQHNSWHTTAQQHHRSDTGQ